MVYDPDDLPEEEPSSPLEKNYITQRATEKLVDRAGILHTSKRPEVVSAWVNAARRGATVQKTPSTSTASASCARLTRACASFPNGWTMSSSWTPRAEEQRPGVLRGHGQVQDENEEIFVYRIVGQDEIEGSEGRSPGNRRWARPCSAKEVGDTVVVRWHAGTRELTVTAIGY